MDGMIRRLRFFLESNGISAYHFNCKHCPVCKDGNPNFAGATEPYIGVNYIKNEFPRILFVSLDPGSADRNPDKRKLVVTENVESDEYNPFLFHKGRHWYETHELAWRILRKFLPGLKLRDIGLYFAHINSAKCCHNNPGGAMGPKIMFDNCRKFITREIEILRPDILVTQGNYAKLVVECGIYNNQKECEESAEIINEDCKVCIITIRNRKVIWVHSYHPAYFRRYWDQKRDCHEVWAEVAYEYLTYHGWERD